MPREDESLAARNMLHVYRMLHMMDPVFVRMAEGLPIRDEDAAKVQQYNLPTDGPQPEPSRQTVLQSRLSVASDQLTGRFPFSNMSLGRVDVLWLLSAAPTGLDLRGADLTKADLRRMDLTHIKFGLTTEEYEECITASLLGAGESFAEETFREAASVNLEEADLSEADLSGVTLVKANLHGAVLMATDLSGADLSEANLEGAQLHYATLAGASLGGAHLRGANLSHVDMRRCLVSNADLTEVHLLHADLRGAYLAGARLWGAEMRHSRFDGGSDLSEVMFVREQPAVQEPMQPESNSAFLADVDWGRANVTGIRWEAVTSIGEERAIRTSRLRREGIREAKKRLQELEHELGVLKPVETLERIKRDFMEGDPPQRRADLTSTEVDEVVAALEIVRRGEPVVEETVRLSKYLDDQAVLFPSELLKSQEDSARAYRQLADLLRSQGLARDSARFAYKALKLQRRIPRRERELFVVAPPSDSRSRLPKVLESLTNIAGRALRTLKSEMKVLASFLVDLVCGYGYRPVRALVAYGVVVAAFAGAYVLVGMRSAVDAMVFSITSFHGRGFSEFLGPLGKSAENHAVQIAAAEAFVGLLMEVVLVATFTRRLFDR